MLILGHLNSGKTSKNTSNFKFHYRVGSGDGGGVVVVEGGGGVRTHDEGGGGGRSYHDMQLSGRVRR